MSLATGARISRHQWTKLPIPDTAIARVEALAIQDNQPLVQERGLVVEWRPDMAIDDNEYDRDFEPLIEPPDPFDLADYDDLAVDELHDLLADVPLPLVVDQGAAEIDNELDNIEIEEDVKANNGDIDDHDDDHEVDEDHGNDDGSDDDNNDDASHGMEAEPIVDDVEEEVTEVDEADEQPRNQKEEGARVPAYNLRRRVDKEHRQFKTAIDNPHSDKSYYPPTQLVQHGETTKIIFGIIMAQQMSARAGIQKVGKAAEEALMAEFAQHADLSVYDVIDPNTLSPNRKEGHYAQST